MQKTVAVLATLDTKGEECRYLRERVEALGGQALLIDLGVVGPAAVAPDVPREEVVAAAGRSWREVAANPTRQSLAPVLIEGATAVLRKLLAKGQVHAVVALGGTQGTSNCSRILQALPYGFPKVMVSTVASGDTSAFVGIKDVTMMFSVSDLLGLNPVTRRILANAAGAAYGMACAELPAREAAPGRPLVGMTNLGVLTEGAMEALRRFQEAGCEAIVFHGVGSGGRAMEQMMKDGLIGAVFDYALGEISDEVFHGLRAGGAERLTVAGKLGLPQVLCPGGAEHIGLLLEQPDTIPPAWQDHTCVFHNPLILAPRLKGPELERVAEEIGRRLASTRGRATMLVPRKGTSRYAVPGGPLHDPEGDARFFAALRRHLPDTVEYAERDFGAEDPAFVQEAVERLVAWMARA